MRFWSEGLGERQLVMDLGKSHIRRLDDVMLLSGVVDSPAPWEYEVKIQRADWETILETAASKEACTFIATHTTLAELFGMAASIVRFIVLLGWYRTLRALGFARPVAPPEVAANAPTSVRTTHDK